MYVVDCDALASCVGEAIDRVKLLEFVNGVDGESEADGVSLPVEVLVAICELDGVGTEPEALNDGRLSVMVAVAARDNERRVRDTVTDLVRQNQSKGDSNAAAPAAKHASGATTSFPDAREALDAIGATTSHVNGWAWVANALVTDGVTNRDDAAELKP